MAVLYAVLSLAAITTLYPFLMMVSTGFKGPTDQDDNRIIPSFWTDDQELVEKYIDDKYAGDLSLISFSSAGADASADTVAKYDQLLLDLPPDLWLAGFRNAPNHITGRLTMRWQGWLREEYDGDIDALNSDYNEINGAFQTIAVPNELLERKGWRPSQDRKWEDWLRFKGSLPSEFRIPIRTTRIFQEFLRSKYGAQIDLVPASIRGEAAQFEQIPWDASSPEASEFEAEALPERFRTTNAEMLWAQISKEPMPTRAFDLATLNADRGQVRREMSSRNYRYVIDYIALHGGALWNTVIFCVLAVLTQLIVNPLAAYALSRFPMKATARILIFLLATMAFPAEVAMIPAFLLLKNMGLLNTFAALVLPTAANGYMIFLLKGFFDSLPREVFESGQIDGASESRMMLRLALPLSKPVLGYMALLAFMGAYGAFLHAFLVAQDREIWTLMVFIYQLQQIAPKSVMMAAVALAAIPSVLVFLAAQRVIMRGIVLPGER